MNIAAPMVFATVIGKTIVSTTWAESTKGLATIRMIDIWTISATSVTPAIRGGQKRRSVLLRRMR
ncbi:hypothetical protein D3C74_504820 [compost metagenome]